MFRDKLTAAPAREIALVVESASRKPFGSEPVDPAHLNPVLERAAQSALRAELARDPAGRGYASAPSKQDLLELLTLPYADAQGVTQAPRLSAAWDQIPYLPNTIDLADLAELE